MAGGAGPPRACDKGLNRQTRALREGASRHMDVAASAASVSDAEASGNGEEMHEQLPSGARRLQLLRKWLRGASGLGQTCDGG